MMQQRHWQRMPFDQRGPPMGFPHPSFRMAPPGGVPMRPPFPGQMPRVRPGNSPDQIEPPRPVETESSKDEHDPAHDSPRSEDRADDCRPENDDDEVWRQRHRKNSEISASLEKARMRREEEERRLETERKAGAAEKLRQLDLRLAAKKGDSPEKGGKEQDGSEHSDKEGRTRTISEESEKEKPREPKHHGGQVRMNLLLRLASLSSL